MLASCNSSPSTPTMSDAEIMQTAISTVSTELAKTQPALPTAIATPSLLPTIFFLTVLPTHPPLTVIPTLTTETYVVVDAGTGTKSVWRGPGIEFGLSGSIQASKKYPVLGKYQDWWLIDPGNHQYGWINVLTHGTRFVGDAEAVPEVPPPPSPTPYVFPSSTPLVFTDPSIPLSERIVYYYDIGYHPEKLAPEGTVWGGSYIAPTYADETYTSDTAADLRTALDIVLHDERNDWIGRSLEAEIADVTFRFGHAKVLLQGEYFLAGPPELRYGWLQAPRMQILLTVFANPAVQTAAVSLNDDTIANLGVSESRDAKPANYVFTRLEIETYLKEHTYVAPAPKTPTPYVTYTTPTPPAFIDPSLPIPELPPDATNLRWITAYGLPGDETATKIHPTKDGGFILVGSEVLLRLRADGLIVWQKSLGQVGALDVLETSSGDFILAGDRHLTKLDSQGNVLWGYTFGEPSYHTGPILRLVEERDGNIVVEALGSRTVFRADGELRSIAEYIMNWDSQTYSGGIRDRAGDTVWAGEAGAYHYWVGKANRNNGWLSVFSVPLKPIGGPPSIQPLADGGAIVSAFIYGEGGYDMLVARVSRDGSVRWQQFYRSGSDFHAFETRSGDLILAWTVYHNWSFTFEADVLILRLDRDGNTRWMKVYGTEGWDPEGQDVVDVIQELSNGDLIFAGHTNGAGTGTDDMWVLKTNARGEIPNCSLALESRDVWTGGVSPQVETIALKGVSVIERGEVPIFEEKQKPLGDAEAQTISICSPLP